VQESIAHLHVILSCQRDHIDLVISRDPIVDQASHVEVEITETVNLGYGFWIGVNNVVVEKISPRDRSTWVCVVNNARKRICIYRVSISDNPTENSVSVPPV